MSPTETPERINPLLSYTPATIDTWEKWLVAWEAAELAEYRHELLHVGLSLFMQNERETIPFYLRIADGHLAEIRTGSNDFGTCRWPGSHREKSNGEIRQILAQKAFAILINKFFAVSSNEHRDNVPDWVQSIFLEGVLEDVVWFLRCENRTVVLEYWGPRNFTTTIIRPENVRAVEVMTAFIVYLTKLTFNRPFFDEVIARTFFTPDKYEVIHDRLVTIRPQLIEPLTYIGQLDLLLEYGVEIDDAWVAELSRVAGVDETTSVAESVMRHNKPAMVLNNIKVIKHGQRVARNQAAIDAARAEAEEMQARRPSYRVWTPYEGVKNDASSWGVVHFRPILTIFQIQDTITCTF